MIRIRVKNGFVEGKVIRRRKLETEKGETVVEEYSPFYFNPVEEGELTLLDAEDVIIEKAEGEYEIIK
jgi:hypothetical protein